MLIYEYITQPRIYFWNVRFIKEDFNLGFKEDPGKNYKLKFKISGFRSPGFCELQIHWCGNVVKAKWDDNPNPLIGDKNDKFEASLVSQTYLNTIMLGEYYTIPVFNIDSGNNITIFDGWWFGKRLKLPYGPDPTVNKNTELKLVLRGNGLSWTKKLTAQEIIDNTK